MLHMIFFSTPTRLWRRDPSSSSYPLKFDHKLFSGAVPRSFLGSMALAWLSKHVTRLANHLSLVTTKFDLQSSFSPSPFTVLRLMLTSPPHSRKHKCARPLPPSTRGCAEFWTLDGRLLCSHYRELVPRAILDGRTLPNMFALLLGGLCA